MFDFKLGMSLAKINLITHYFASLILLTVNKKKKIANIKVGTVIYPKVDMWNPKSLLLTLLHVELYLNRLVGNFCYNAANKL